MTLKVWDKRGHLVGDVRLDEGLTFDCRVDTPLAVPRRFQAASPLELACWLLDHDLSLDSIWFNGEECALLGYEEHKEDCGYQGYYVLRSPTRGYTQAIDTASPLLGRGVAHETIAGRIDDEPAAGAPSTGRHNAR